MRYSIRVPHVLKNMGHPAGIDDFQIEQFNCDAEPCPADLDGDGAVGAPDLAQLLASWGECEHCPADLNDDGEVGPLDLATLLGAWGPCL